MTRRKVSFLQGTVPAPYKLPAEDHRLNHAGLWVPDSVGGGLRVRSGILPGPGNPGKVTVVAGGVNINPFQPVIQGTLSGTQGVYETVSDAVEFRAITAASSTEFRRGYVIARVYDQLNAGTGTVKDDWDIEVVYGPNAATAGAATLPPLPANTLVLREFAVSNTGVITLAGSLPPWTVARGGIPPVDAADAVAPAYDGQYRDHPLYGLQRGFGGAWVSPLAGEQPVAVVQPVLNAGWAHYNDGNAGWTGLRYWKRNGIVTIAGAVITSAATAANSALFTLPAGFNPPAPLADFSNFQVIASGVVRQQTGRASGFAAPVLLTFPVAGA